MTRRLAASLSLLVFAVCLIVGMESGNTLETVLSRSLLAMAGTMVISLVIGTMAQYMLDESLKKREQEFREKLAAAAAAESGSEAAGGVVAEKSATPNKNVGKQGRTDR